MKSIPSAELADTSSPALLDWPYVQQKFPWSVLLLLGCGYVISDASKVSGLTLSVGNSLSSLATLPPSAVMVLMCLLASIVTELASNTAVASILVPIVAQIVRKFLVANLTKFISMLSYFIGRSDKTKSALLDDSGYH